MTEREQRILAHVDHTLLKPEARWEEVQVLCDDAIRYGTCLLYTSRCV